jgi:hypothetical protein
MEHTETSRAKLFDDKRLQLPTEMMRTNARLMLLILAAPCRLSSA